MKYAPVTNARIIRVAAVALSGIVFSGSGVLAGNPGTPVEPGHTAPAAAPASNPPQHAAGNASVQTSPAAKPANQPAAAPGSTGDRDRGHHDRNNNNNYNVGYINPWWPYGSGWDEGGDGNYNTGNYTEPTYTNNNSNTGTTPQAPVTPTPTQTTPTPASVAAQTTNAVNKSPEMVAANNSVQTAQAAYDTERERVLAELGKTPEYQQALARKHDAAKDLRTVKDSDKGQPAVIDAATAKMDASDELTKMQEQAVATDPAASEAKSKLAAAVADRDTLRAKLTAQVGPR